MYIIMKHDNSKKPHISTDAMAILYREGLSATQIASKLGLFKSSVSRRLKKSGITLRSSSSYEGKLRYWRWKGDDYIDPMTRKRNQLKHRKWSRSVRSRDRNTCQDCGITNVRLEAHHLISLRECINSDLEFDVQNGVTVCSKCHKHRHKV